MSWYPYRMLGLWTVAFHAEPHSDPIQVSERTIEACENAVRVSGRYLCVAFFNYKPNLGSLTLNFPLFRVSEMAFICLMCSLLCKFTHTYKILSSWLFGSCCSVNALRHLEWESSRVREPTFTHRSRKSTRGTCCDLVVSPKFRW